jgi:hypothetical protein
MRIRGNAVVVVRRGEKFFIHGGIKGHQISDRIGIGK